MSSDASPDLELTTQIPIPSSQELEQEHQEELPQHHHQQQQVTTVAKDMFSLYSLSFLCKSKDLSERRIKLDFSLVAEVSVMAFPVGSWF